MVLRITGSNLGATSLALVAKCELMDSDPSKVTLGFLFVPCPFPVHSTHDLLSVCSKPRFQVCDSKEAGKQQHKAAVNVIAKFLIQNKGAFLPASKEEEEEDVVTIPIRKQR